MDSGRDHGGEIRAAMARFGGTRCDWLDLSTGINPCAYPLPPIPPDAWSALPDSCDIQDLEAAARKFWRVPDGADVMAAPGASALIAQIPGLFDPGTVSIPEPTYNEHMAAFEAHGWARGGDRPKVQVLVHPNNPDGRFWAAEDLDGAEVTVIDESFCDVAPEWSMVSHATTPGRLVLKSFGKFWGLAGLRLGFAIGDRSLISALRTRLGPWQVSGPAIRIGTLALGDIDWADATRARLAGDAVRLDDLMATAGHRPVGGTSLFRLYQTDAAALYGQLGNARILTRKFPYSSRWIRLGLPGTKANWSRLEAAL